MVDKLPNGGGSVLRYLAYDILAENNRSLLDLNFADRLLALQSRVIAPQLAWLARSKNFKPAFEVRLKQMYCCRDVKYVCCKISCLRYLTEMMV